MGKVRGMKIEMGMKEGEEVGGPFNFQHPKWGPSARQAASVGKRRQVSALQSGATMERLKLPCNLPFAWLV